MAKLEELKRKSVEDDSHDDASGSTNNIGREAADGEDAKEDNTVNANSERGSRNSGNGTSDAGNDNLENKTVLEHLIKVGRINVVRGDDDEKNSQLTSSHGNQSGSTLPVNHTVSEEIKLTELISAHASLSGSSGLPAGIIDSDGKANKDTLVVIDEARTTPGAKMSDTNVSEGLLQAIGIGITVSANTTPGAYACSVEEVTNSSEQASPHTRMAPTTSSSDPQLLTRTVLEAVVVDDHHIITPMDNDTSPEPETPIGDLIEGEKVTSWSEEHVSRRGLVLSLVALAILVVVIVLLSLGLSGVFEDDIGAWPSNITTSSMSNRSPTLERIRKEGVLLCGHDGLIPELFWPDENGVHGGLLVEMYSAVAAAANAELEFVDVPVDEMFDALREGKFDVLLRDFVPTMENHVYHKDIAFSYPFGFAGVMVAGVPFFVQCLDQGFQHLDECSELKLCYSVTARAELVVHRLLPQKNLVERNASGEEPIAGFLEGACNVVASSNILQVSEANLRRLGYQGNYSIGTNTFLTDPHSMVSRAEDPVFADFVSTTIQSLLVAQKLNITQSTAKDFPQTLVFGEEYKDMYKNAIAAVGQYQEVRLRIYLRNNLVVTPAMTINNINNGSTGLMFPYPLGNLEVGPSVSACLNAIMQRGTLRCGVVPNRPGFVNKSVDGTYVGFDIDYCNAIAGSLFFGEQNRVIFVELGNATDGFVQLAAGDIDVLTSAVWTLENDVKEPTTGVGFSFSKPYFYGYSEQEDNFCLATRQDDPGFSAFVFWCLMSTIHAEANEIHQNTSNQMPEVYVFGPDHKRMFRNVILAVGNYAEIYERNQAYLVPRGGRNLLNVSPNIGPQHYIMPGFG